MVDSYPTYHCDNCGKEYYVKGKKVLLYVLFVTCVSVEVSIVAYSLQDYSLLFLVVIKVNGTSPKKYEGLVQRLLHIKDSMLNPFYVNIDL